MILPMQQVDQEKYSQHIAGQACVNAVLDLHGSANPQVHHCGTWLSNNVEHLTDMHQNAVDAFMQAPKTDFVDTVWDKFSKFIINLDECHYPEDAIKEEQECQSTWAFAVCMEDIDQETHFTGCLTGPVITDCSSTHYLGVDVPPPGKAEAVAMLWALSWALAASLHMQQHAPGVVPTILFRYDCMFIGGVAFLHYALQTSTKIAFIIRYLAFAVSKVAIVEHQHVPSHQWGCLG